VTSCSDPVAAIDHLKNEKIDLLLADIQLSDAGGLELITNIQKHQPEMAVLIMTGIGTIELAEEALPQGVADGLPQEPFEKGIVLIHAVEQALIDSQKKRDISRIQSLRPIFDISESFLAETRSDRLFDLILTAVCGHLRCTNAGFYRKTTSEKLVPILTKGNAFPEDDCNQQAGLIGRTDALSTPIWVNASGSGDTELQHLLLEKEYSSAIAVPVRRQNIRGVLFAARDSTSPEFRDVDFEMLILLTRQAAIAMENALLYEDQREYVRMVEESQQVLIRTEKLAAAGRLTASIAHEINNPLQAVQNCLHLALKDELEPEKREEYLKLANTELERLMSTVQRMLDFYRPDGVDPQQVDISLLLKHVLSLLASQFEERGIRITTGFSSKLPNIIAVASQLEQVFLNLILNSFDAMPEGGELRITARLAKNMVEIMFQDTGPGVPEAERGHIFEPFISTKKNGTGLGLSVSYGIIAAHGGSIDLLPQRGKGACFRVLLPVKGEK
jgi:signal transduction histidine kinase/CheY-like chemotaxis protein